MKQLRSLTLTGAIVLAATSAQAAPILLDFEDVGDRALVNDFYNGGTDSAGNAGSNFGVQFSSTPGARAGIDADAGGSAGFANEPSPDTVAILQLPDGATMNVAAGFDMGFSFFYVSQLGGSVTVYDGLNATGTVLAMLDLAGTGSDCQGDPNGAPYCRWVPVDVTFSGTGRSVFFGPSGFDDFGLDDIALDLTGDGEIVVPEPGALALLGAGLAALGFVRRRRTTG